MLCSSDISIELYILYAKLPRHFLLYLFSIWTFVTPCNPKYSLPCYVSILIRSNEILLFT